MFIIKDICNELELFADLSLQESYDNAGLIVGNAQAEAKAVLLTIDVTEAVVDEAIARGANLIVAHHPFVFKGIKRFTGNNDVERSLLKAIKHDIAIYAAHTNIDAVMQGVNGKIAEKIGLKDCQILQPKAAHLLKLVTFVPQLHVFAVRDAIFAAGAGNIGNYDSCSFSGEGWGTFKAQDGAQPFVGQIDALHSEKEIRIEFILPVHKRQAVIAALLKAHPYEAPAYDLYALENDWQQAGSGMVGELDRAEDSMDFLCRIKAVFGNPTVRHTKITSNTIQRVALCGGSGSFLLKNAIAAKADIFISADFKYHEFFDAENKIIIADVGHFESEQFTKEIFYEIFTKKFPTFAILISEINTNPINYL